MQARAPNVFTIAPGAPFLDVLTAAIRDGSLDIGMGAPEPLALAAATIYLPTRRAARALADALHRAYGQAVLMPEIAGLGEDESPLAFLGEDHPADAAAVVSEAERHAVLADIAMDWSGSKRRPSGDGSEVGPDPVPRTAAEAAAFAIELARFLDELTVAGIGRDQLARIVPEEQVELARNWEISLKFLTHAIERWAAHLRTRRLVERVARRDRRLENEAARLEREGSPAPVIAAGSTGSIRAAAALLRAIARLDNGAVVLPGLDRDLDEQGWSELGPDHPQFMMKRLIGLIGVERGEVRVLGSALSPRRTVRARLVSEIMRPAATAELWVESLAALGEAELRAALSDVSLIEAGDEHEEARVIALMLRRAADEPDCFTALVTPDRTLARRVAGELARWRLTIDDSAGQPLATTVPGVFMRLIAEAAARAFAPVATLGLLKHPLTRLGLDPGAVRHAARVVEIAAMRGARPAPGIDGLVAALDRFAAGKVHHPVAARLTGRDFDSARDLLGRLGRAFSPLVRLAASSRRAPLGDLVTAHIEAAEALARGREGEPIALWSGGAGEAAAAFLAELIAAARHAAPLHAGEFGGWLEQMLRGRVVRLASAGPANIAIWGPLEARLQRIDRLILSGLNEGVWPGETETDPWLGRQMRAGLGLDAPERRIGLQAHDVAEGLNGDRVILTRAMKVGGTPAVRSRWIWRLVTLAEAAGCKDALEADEPWIGWARGLDAVEHVMPCAPPKPAPPVGARPKRLSVTRIETLLRDPYAIYASEILGLRPLDHLDLNPDASDYGSIIHAALGRLIEEFPQAPLPDQALARLFALGRAEFSVLDDRPGLKGYWLLRFERVARWFISADAELREPRAQSLSEVTGRIEVCVPGANEPFTLTARADRIDLDGAGAAVIIDYKTGSPPTGNVIEALLAPQLPLEAAILMDGGFDGIAALPVRGLVHVALTGREPAGELRAITRDPSEIAGRALELLRGLIARYADPSRPYLSRVAPQYADRAGDFDHLARVGEWSLALGRSHDG